MAQLNAKIVELEEENDKLKRRVADGGSLFDLHKDTIQDIARLIVDTCTPSRVESLIRGLRGGPEGPRRACRLSCLAASPTGCHAGDA
jgi:hypothetical protein